MKYNCICALMFFNPHKLRVRSLMATAKVIVVKKMMAFKTKSKTQGRINHGKQKMSIEFVLANQQLDLTLAKI